MRRFLGILITTLALGSAASGQGKDVISAEILPGWRTAHGTHMAAVRLTLAPGWKTYWRAPGEGGIPPQINFEGSRNVSAVHTHFPAPQVFYASGIRSIGYSGEVVFPIELTVPNVGGRVQFEARMDIGVCEDICMPMSLNLRASLPASGGQDRAIAQALAARPDAYEADMDCEITPISDGVRIAVRHAVPPGVASGAVSIVEPGDPTIWATDTETDVRGRYVTSTVEFVPPRGQPMMLDRSAIRVTVLGGARAFELQGCD